MVQVNSSPFYLSRAYLVGEFEMQLVASRYLHTAILIIYLCKRDIWWYRSCPYLWTVNKNAQTLCGHWLFGGKMAGGEAFVVLLARNA